MLVAHDNSPKEQRQLNKNSPVVTSVATVHSFNKKIQKGLS
jgi:hypothetical protein